jgi:hypothetical protein
LKQAGSLGDKRAQHRPDEIMGQGYGLWNIPSGATPCQLQYTGCGVTQCFLNSNNDKERSL